MRTLRIMALILVLSFTLSSSFFTHINTDLATEGIYPPQINEFTPFQTDEGQVETGEIESAVYYVNASVDYRFYTNKEEASGAYPGDEITWFIKWQVRGDPEDVRYYVQFQVIDRQTGHVWAEKWDDKRGDGSQAHVYLSTKMPDHDLWFYIAMFDSSMRLLDKTADDVIYRRVLSTENPVDKDNQILDGYNLFMLRQKYNDPTYTVLVTDMEGGIIRGGNSFAFPQGSWVIEGSTTQMATFINSTTILYETSSGAALWDIYQQKRVFLGFDGHHEYAYNPLNNTIFTFRSYTIIIDGDKYLFDKIVEFDLTGKLVWSLDTRSFISHTQQCPYGDWKSDAVDVTHANSLFFDPDEDIFYFHPRNVNTFYKIDHKTGQVLWGLGEYGNFTMYNQYGTPRQSLFYHAHGVKKVDENTFILFDNDKHNQTKGDNHRSRMLEITINETTMTANESWAWIAPPEYYSASLGDADRLANGNRLGTFGDVEGVATLVEVTESGEVVWEMLCPHTTFTYTIYRADRFRLSPILIPHPDIRATFIENITVNWQTWYNFNTNQQIHGSYTLFLNGDPFVTNSHIFDKYWRSTNLTVNLGRLLAGNYNLTLVLADEAGHVTTDSVDITVTEFYISRKGPVTIEYGQQNSNILWNGNTTTKLIVSLSGNSIQLDSFVWNGSTITLDLNSFEVGIHRVTLHLLSNSSTLVYEDSFLMEIYPTEIPLVTSMLETQVFTWNESIILTWELFDYSPASWILLLNDTIKDSGTWETSFFELQLDLRWLSEGHHNVTFIAYDLIGNWASWQTWITVIPPSPPIIAHGPSQTEFLWGQENVSLCWEVHGGTNWILWKNGTLLNEGIKNNTQFEIQIDTKSGSDWSPGIYNLTLQIIEDDGTLSQHMSWIQIYLPDAYANSLVTDESKWYRDGENAIGPPDGTYAYLYFDYGNGHVTLDMGLGEEILDGTGIDFTIYARRDEYMVFVGNNLSAPILAENPLSAPLVPLGIGIGNTSFDLADVGLNQAQYIQIVYRTGDSVEIDAVEAIYFNQPHSSTKVFDRWKFPIFGLTLVLSAIGVIWVYQRKYKT